MLRNKGVLQQVWQLAARQWLPLVPRPQPRQWRQRRLACGCCWLLIRRLSSVLLRRFALLLLLLLLLLPSGWRSSSCLLCSRCRLLPLPLGCELLLVVPPLVLQLSQAQLQPAHPPLHTTPRRSPLLRVRTTLSCWRLCTLLLPCLFAGLRCCRGGCAARRQGCCCIPRLHQHCIASQLKQRHRLLRPAELRCACLARALCMLRLVLLKVGFLIAAVAGWVDITLCRRQAVNLHGL